MISFPDAMEILIEAVRAAGPILLCLACWRLHRLGDAPATLLAAIASTVLLFARLAFPAAGWILSIPVFRDHGAAVLQWLMKVIPVSELVALPGTLFALAWFFHATRPTADSAESA